MSKPVISVGPETPVPEAAALLARHRISGVPVLDGGRLVGVVNEWDLMHRQEIGTEQVPAIGPWWRRLFRADKAPAQYVKSHAISVRDRDIMTREVVSVGEGATLSHIAALFDARRIRRLPVLRDGKVVGIITRANLVDALAASTQGNHRPSERTAATNCSPSWRASIGGAPSGRR
jgi:CBS domain-containing protein